MRIQCLFFLLLTILVTGCAPSDQDDIPTSDGTQGLHSSHNGTSILRADPRLDALVPADAEVEKLAEGFVFIEGPVWSRRDSRLLFSDVRGNKIYQWTRTNGATTFLAPIFEGDQTGLRSISSNGLTFDAMGRLIICEHGNRRISRLEPDGSRSLLVDRYEGKRLNSPNDAVYSSNGWLYFTDPPYGLEGLEESPLRELDFNGVYRLSPEGELELLVRDQSRPNGIALSPDEQTLYVANSDTEKKVWMAYDVNAQGATNGRIFYDVNDQDAPGAADGLKVDSDGNVFATGPGGVWIFSPGGTHLGTIQTDEVTANVGWGNDGHSLYMTSSTGLYRIQLTTRGAIP